MKYGLFIKNGIVVSKACIINENKIPVLAGTDFEFCTKTAYDAAVLLATVPYNADTLIAWAFSQVFVADLIPHMAAFLDFANKATATSKANFLAYATAVSLLSVAQTIIAKAIELGADITA